MAKRAGDELDSTEVEKRGLGVADPEGSWMCPFCQNVNWPKRTTCNKDGCHMPKDLGGLQHPEGSWACVGCNNVNWPKRTDCNKCRLPRTTGGGAKAVNAGLGGTQPGSWYCACGNLNWPARTSCNKRGCGQPKPSNAVHMTSMSSLMGGMPGMGGGMAGMAGLDPYSMAMGGLGGGMGMGNPYGMGMPAMGMPAPAMGGNPVGSWQCVQCSNINWPKRTTCNKAGCGAPRQDGMAGMDTMAGMAGGAAAPAGGNPDGSWGCPTCGNVNWPLRTVCNKQGCDTPRPL